MRRKIKSIFTFLSILITFAIVLAFFGCGSKLSKKGISISAGKIEVVEGETNEITFSSEKFNISELKFILTVKDNDIANVTREDNSNSVTIKGLKKGKTELAIEVIDPNVKFKVIINVTEGSGTTIAKTDAEKVAADKKDLTINTESISTVGNGPTLPAKGTNGSNITWVSNNTEILGNDGKVITLPVNSDVTVKLTATIKLGDVQDTKEFEIVVKKEASTHVNDKLTFNITAEGTEKVYIIGSFNNALDWNLDNAIEMQKEGSLFRYVLDLNGVAFPMTFKFLCAKNWSNQELREPSASEQPNHEIKTLEEAITYNHTITGWVNQPVVTTKKSLDFIITAPEGTERLFVVGSFNNVGEWKTENATELTRVETSNVFKYTLNLTGISFPIKFKFLHDNTLGWDAEQEGATITIGSEINEIENFTYTITAWKNPPAQKVDRPFKFKVTIHNVDFYNGYNFYVVAIDTNFTRPHLLVKEGAFYVFEKQEHLTTSTELNYHIIATQISITESFNWEDVHKACKSGTQTPFVGLESNKAVLVDNTLTEIEYDVQAFEGLAPTFENINIPFTITAKNTEKVYMVGNFQTPEWNLENAIKLTREGELFRTTLTGLTISAEKPLKYKFLCYKDWEAAEVGDDHVIINPGLFNLEEGIIYEITNWKHKAEDFKERNFKIVADIMNVQYYLDEGFSFYYVGSDTGFTKAFLLVEEAGKFVYEKTNFISPKLELEYHILASKVDLSVELDWSQAHKACRLGSIEPLPENENQKAELNPDVLNIINNDIRNFKDLSINIQNFSLPFTITAPTGTANVYVYGSFNNWDAVNTVKLEKDIDGLFKGTITGLNATQETPLEYKFLCYPNWEAEESRIGGEPHKIYNPASINLSVGIVYEITNWTHTADEFVNKQFRVEANILNAATLLADGYNFYFIGNDTGFTKAFLLEEIAGKFVYENLGYVTYKENLEFHILASKVDLTQEFKWEDGYKAFKPGTYAKFEDMTNNSVALSEGTLTTFEYYLKGFETITELPTEFSVPITVTEYPADTDKIFIYGSFNNWDLADARELQKVGTEYKITLNNITAPFTYKFLAKQSYLAEEKDIEHTLDLDALRALSEIGIVYQIIEWRNNPSDIHNYHFKFELYIDAVETELTNLGYKHFYVVTNIDEFKEPHKLLVPQGEHFAVYEDLTFMWASTDYKLKYHIIASKEELTNPIDLAAVKKSFKNGTYYTLIDGEFNEADLTPDLVTNIFFISLGFTDVTAVPETVEIPCTVTSFPAGTTNIYIYGSFNNWDLFNAIEMTRDGDVFGAMIPNVKTGETLRYKFMFIKNADAEEKTLGDAAHELNPLTIFIDDGVIHEIAEWENEASSFTKYPLKFSAEIRNYETKKLEGYKFYLVSGQTGWNRPILLTESGSLLVAPDFADNYQANNLFEYHVVASKLDLELGFNWDDVRKSFKNGTYYLMPNTENNTVTLTNTLDFNEIKHVALGFVDDKIPETEDLKVLITAPVDTNEVYLYGSFNNWDLNNPTKLTKNAEGKFELVLNIKLAEELKYKFLSGKGYLEYEECDSEKTPVLHTISITDLQKLNYEVGIIYEINHWLSTPQKAPFRFTANVITQTDLTGKYFYLYSNVFGFVSETEWALPHELEYNHVTKTATFENLEYTYPKGIAKFENFEYLILVSNTKIESEIIWANVHKAFANGTLVPIPVDGKEIVLLNIDGTTTEIINNIHGFEGLNEPDHTYNANIKVTLEGALPAGYNAYFISDKESFDLGIKPNKNVFALTADVDGNLVFNDTITRKPGAAKGFIAISNLAIDALTAESMLYHVFENIVYDGFDLLFDLNDTDINISKNAIGFGDKYLKEYSYELKVDVTTPKNITLPVYVVNNVHNWSFEESVLPNISLGFIEYKQVEGLDKAIYGATLSITTNLINFEYKFANGKDFTYTVEGPNRELTLNYKNANTIINISASEDFNGCQHTRRVKFVLANYPAATNQVALIGNHASNWLFADVKEFTKVDANWELILDVDNEKVYNDPTKPERNNKLVFKLFDKTASSNQNNWWQSEAQGWDDYVLDLWNEVLPNQQFVEGNLRVTLGKVTNWSN